VRPRTNQAAAAGLGGLGLDLTPDEPAPDALELFPHVQLGCVEVDLIPGQAKYFAPAQAEDQDEGGIKRSTRVPGRFEKPAGIIVSATLGPMLKPCQVSLDP
jgi:hypothetical protein